MNGKFTEFIVSELNEKDTQTHFWSVSHPFQASPWKLEASPFRPASMTSHVRAFFSSNFGFNSGMIEEIASDNHLSICNTCDIEWYIGQRQWQCVAINHDASRTSAIVYIIRSGPGKSVKSMQMTTAQIIAHFNIIINLNGGRLRKFYFANRYSFASNCFSIIVLNRTSFGFNTTWSHFYAQSFFSFRFVHSLVETVTRCASKIYLFRFQCIHAYIKSVFMQATVIKSPDSDRRCNSLGRAKTILCTAYHEQQTSEHIPK